jgi:hypothetical protein
MFEFNDYILIDKLEIFKKEVQKLTRKAVKLDVPPIKFTIHHNDKKIEEFITGEVKGKPIYTPFEVIRVSISGENPTLNGWRLCASIDFEMGIGNVVNVVPGETVDTKYREHDNFCDHCKSTRRRTQVFVLKNVDGSEAVVGRNCLKDFLGSSKIQKLMQGVTLPTLFGDLFADCRSGFERCEPVYAPELIIALAIHDISNRGFYMSSSKYQEQVEQGLEPAPTTSSMVCGFLFNQNPKYRYYPTTEEFAEATKIMEWVATLNTDNDYNYNIANLCKGTAVRSKYFGYLCSIPAGFARAMNLIEAKARREPSEYVGTVGEKITTTFKNSWKFSSYYGSVIMNKFVDADDNIIVWTTSTHNDFDVNQTYKIKGTIKTHQIYRDDKQTVLTRVKLI